MCYLCVELNGILPAKMKLLLFEPTSFIYILILQIHYNNMCVCVCVCCSLITPCILYTFFRMAYAMHKSCIQFSSKFNAMAVYFFFLLRCFIAAADVVLF